MEPANLGESMEPLWATPGAVVLVALRALEAAKSYCPSSKYKVTRGARERFVQAGPERRGWPARGRSGKIGRACGSPAGPPPGQRRQGLAGKVQRSRQNQ